jgi:hypothetical protein
MFEKKIVIFDFEEAKKLEKIMQRNNIKYKKEVRKSSKGKVFGVIFKIGNQDIPFRWDWDWDEIETSHVEM